MTLTGERECFKNYLDDTIDNPQESPIKTCYNIFMNHLAIKYMNIKAHLFLKNVYVSDCGKVYYSLDKCQAGKSKELRTPYPVCIPARVYEDRYGYHYVTLPNTISRLNHYQPRKKFKVHQLVAHTFIDNPNNIKRIDHIDDNPKNNHVSNLRWFTLSQNNKKSNTGFNALNRYTREDKLTALDLMINKGLHYSEVSMITGIKTNTLCEAKRGDTWKREWEIFDGQPKGVGSSEPKRKTP